ncbi:MAG: helix-turn-helix transcriptional regulator [Anaerolineaceae bacterium]|nr:helix-turn-helix transcriptional regulator [Anaerolineaceae bacterium]
MNDKIVKLIREVRNERGLTQQDLANYLGRTAASISDLERGKVQVTASDLFLISQFLNKPVEYFFGEEYIGDDVQDIIAIFRKMDPEIRALQIPIIKSLLLMQQKADSISPLDTTDEELSKPLALELYELLIPYLSSITELRSKGMVTKMQLEEVLGLSDKPTLSEQN